MENIAAQNLDAVNTVSVGGLTIRYSGLSYAYMVLKNPQASETLVNTVKALYFYNRSAEEYFN